ncbi:hypothetical protein TCE0_033r08580 [Talaromyces pinophilus]|uniref:Major facilitator superfamily (MFS) profile domain-containing protein n=1 Tax=Talaromyces pinophilus TaxID=128442 RepID=A0A6V8HCJ3_TALPI|nr:hypothetical protein PENOC_040830 [Penicillium occitanis (nom. inval.)]PCH03835.1 Major facilitator superfamily domain, general substrate transporter [Penicillium occitanis (nom. inval.)]GAM38105.1 hypothetical protein TCE0_033r08580 [Talaromyces pinophilus]
MENGKTKSENSHLEVVSTSQDAERGDVGLAVFSGKEDLASAIDPVAERKLIRKIDMFVVPFICVTYLVTYIDKATLGYAAVFGLQTDLHLHGSQYSWLGSIFYFGYLAFEYPTSFAMQKLSVTKWLSANLFIWGGITMALGGCQNFSSFAALRFIMGALESCSTPAYLLITAMWYRIEEQPIRIGYWSTFLGLANAFGGLLCYLIGHIHGALGEPWRYQFLIIGAISSLWGLIMFFTFAENATAASWLSADEKKLAIERLRDNQTGIKNSKVKRYQIIEAMTDPKTWIFFLLGVASQVVNGAASNFGSLIIKGFGFSSLETTLLQIPYGFIIIFSNLSAMYLQRWLPGQKRCIVACLYVLPSLAGAVGIHTISRNSKGALLACYWLTSTYTASFSMIMSLITANTAGSTKRSVVNALFFVSYCAGNIVGPFAFKPSEAPEYTSGIIAMLVSYCAEIVLMLAFAAYMMYLNKKKEESLDTGLGQDEADRIAAGFSDQTDRENPYFRYYY